jgi:hypothetical protein
MIPPQNGKPNLDGLRDLVTKFEKQQFPIGWDCWRDEAANPAEQSPARPTIQSGAQPAAQSTPAQPGCPETEAAASRNPTQVELAESQDAQLFRSYILAALPGWILTAIAVSLGAPFWFGLLQQVVNLRNAGSKPPRADALPAAGSNS